MTSTNWDNVIDRLQTGLVWFVIIVTVVCTCALILFDVLVGAGTMYFLTQQNVWVSVVISMATTGLLMALMFIGYNLSKNENDGIQYAGWGVAILAFAVYCLDVYFDSLTADILRFGSIVQTEEMVHYLFRALLGGISTIGEAMAISIIVGMPVLKTIINNAIPSQYRQYRPAQSQQRQTQQRYEQTVPSSIPRAVPKPRPAPKPSEDYPSYHTVNSQERET